MTASSKRSRHQETITVLARLLLMIGFSELFVPLCGQATAYCAFEVNVRAPDGRPIAKLPVALIRNDKTTFSESTTDAKGVARICDAPLEYVDILVGSDICGSVMVRHLPPNWPESRRVYITYADTPCNHFIVPPTCRVVLRIQDESGRAIVGARLDAKRSSTPISAASDVFGRLFSSVRRGDVLEGVVVKGDLHSAPISQNCMDVENVELKIVLHK
jgi:hypothetical protein